LHRFQIVLSLFLKRAALNYKSLDAHRSVLFSALERNQKSNAKQRKFDNVSPAAGKWCVSLFGKINAREKRCA